MIAETVEQTLNGGFLGLYGEVVTEDTYKLKSLKFVPDAILDLGANVGIFTRYASSLFPLAKIISVEPDSGNFIHLTKFTHPKNTVFINKAIGIGSVYHLPNAENGAHEKYVSVGVGDYRSGQETNIETIMLDELVNRYTMPWDFVVLKCDIEGNEVVLWDHKPSLDAMRKIDYIAMETHWWEKERRNLVLESFRETHDCEISEYLFYATKKVL